MTRRKLVSGNRVEFMCTRGRRKKIASCTLEKFESSVLSVALPRIKKNVGSVLFFFDCDNL